MSKTLERKREAFRQDMAKFKAGLEELRKETGIKILVDRYDEVTLLWKHGRETFDVGWSGEPHFDRPIRRRKREVIPVDPHADDDDPNEPDE